MKKIDKIIEIKTKMLSIINECQSVFDELHRLQVEVQREE